MKDEQDFRPCHCGLKLSAVDEGNLKQCIKYVKDNYYRNKNQEIGYRPTPTIGVLLLLQDLFRTFVVF